MDLRIVSYNVLCFPWISTNIHDIVHWIVTNADIAVLQEVWCRHEIWAAAFAVKGWTLVRPTREAHILGIFGSGMATAFRTTMWRLDDARFYPFLNSAGFDIFTSKGWFRTVLTHAATGCSIRIVNTHMQSDIENIKRWTIGHTEIIRQKQCLQLAENEHRYSSRHESAALIIGDFNTDQCWIPGASWLETDTGQTMEEVATSLDHLAIPSDATPYVNLLTHRVAREINWSDHWPILWTIRILPRIVILSPE